jgi:hypothetical protein
MPSVEPVMRMVLGMNDALSIGEVWRRELGHYLFGQTFHGFFSTRVVEPQIQCCMVHADLLHRLRVRAKVIRAQSETQMDRLWQGLGVFGQINI